MCRGKRRPRYDNREVDENRQPGKREFFVIALERTTLEATGGGPVTPFLDKNLSQPYAPPKMRFVLIDLFRQ